MHILVASFPAALHSPPRGLQWGFREVMLGQRLVRRLEGIGATVNTALHRTALQFFGCGLLSRSVVTGRETEVPGGSAAVGATHRPHGPGPVLRAPWCVSLIVVVGDEGGSFCEQITWNPGAVISRQVKRKTKALSCLSITQPLGTGRGEFSPEKSVHRGLDGHLALGSLKPWQRSPDTSLNCSEPQFTHG